MDKKWVYKEKDDSYGWRSDNATKKEMGCNVYRYPTNALPLWQSAPILQLAPIPSTRPPSPAYAPTNTTVAT
jgi:hypothetical protein